MRRLRDVRGAVDSRSAQLATGGRHLTAVAFLGETVGIGQAVGGVLIVAGVLVISRDRPDSAEAPEAPRPL